MTDEQQPVAIRLAELPEETRDFLTNLSREDIETIRIGLPVFRKVMGAGQVLKWVGFFVLSLAAGIVLLGESIGKILSWFKGA
jgi:hypothetical protein